MMQRINLICLMVNNVIASCKELSLIDFGLLLVYEIPLVILDLSWSLEKLFLLFNCIVLLNTIK